MIIYQGPSALDGAEIVAIATGLGRSSKNRKTGDMIQIWILRADVNPVAAVRSGADRSICGDCRHRGRNGAPRTCYVNVGQAPQAVWRAHQAGKYPVGSSAELVLAADGRPIRLGSYGDPAAVPWSVLEPFEQVQRTGYTHQWRDCDQRLKSLVQASCDSHAEMIDAALMGWKAFLVEPTHADAIFRPTHVAGKPLIECINSSHGTNCAQCRVCDGTKAHIWIAAHGAAKEYVK